jgi:predicted DsbA family dithiol-disulfide isomerase
LVSVASDLVVKPRIDVWIDIVCPWCLIGNHRLERALVGVADPGVRYHPFLLDPGTPPEGEYLATRLRRKYGGDPRRMQARVEEVARKDGIPLDFGKVTRIYPTVAAQTLLRSSTNQRALAQALLEAYFFEGQNINDVDVLVEIGRRHGFDPDEARRLTTDESELNVTRHLSRQASEAGINGVPFFVFDERLALSGAQPLDLFRRAIQETAEPATEDARE